jgi:hypothetical protein
MGTTVLDTKHSVSQLQKIALFDRQLTVIQPDAVEEGSVLRT